MSQRQHSVGHYSRLLLTLGSCCVCFSFLSFALWADLSTSQSQGGDDEMDTTFVGQLDEQLSTVQQLRQEVEQLRSTVADQYAQELGSGCPVQ